MVYGKAIAVESTNLRVIDVLGMRMCRKCQHSRYNPQFQHAGGGTKLQKAVVFLGAAPGHLIWSRQTPRARLSKN